MFEIRPEVLYTKSDLARFTEEAGIDVDYFLSRLKAPKRFKGLWWGRDILEALEAVPVLGDAPTAISTAPKGRGGRRKKRTETDSGGLIGGMFTREGLGIDAN